MKDTALHWYVAKVRSCQEKVTTERIRKMGIEAWIPLQRQRRKWSDRIKVVEVVLITQHVFVHCTADQILEIYKNISAVVFFLKKSKSSNEKAFISDAEMKNFMLFIGSAGNDMKYEPNTWHPGDKVIITSGPMAGVQGVLTKIGDKNMLSVRLSLLGSAITHVPSDGVIVMKDEA